MSDFLAHFRDIHANLQKVRTALLFAISKKETIHFHYLISGHLRV